MKYLVFVFFLLFVSCGFTQKDVVELQHSDGTPKKVVRYKYGIKTKELEYYFSGMIKKEVSFKDSVKHGEWRVWHEYGGSLYAKGNYRMGKREGIMTEYNEGGTKVREVLYENGENMVTTKFYWNGSKSTEINGKDDKYYGWYESGQLQVEIPNIKGVNREYYEDGAKKVEGSIKEGKQNGAWSYWDPSGKLIKEITFKDNVAIDSVIHITELANTIKSVWN